MTKKLLVLMVDGIAAEHYAQDRGRFPHFAMIEDQGFRVERLRSEVLGTSLPGRTSILTGVTADQSGVYGNKIWDAAEACFRYANPDDIRVPTLAARTQAADKRVASLGFGMVRPQDADVFHTPFWVDEFLQRARDTEPVPSDASWLRVFHHDPGERFREICAAAGVPAQLPSFPVVDRMSRLLYEVQADALICDWAGLIAASPDAPDLVLVEYLATDTVQHGAGYRSEVTQWVTELADQALGKILQRLRAAGTLDQWNIAVMSDHGHSAIQQVIRPQVVLPGVRVQCEGQCLLVAPRDAAELAYITETLAGYDAAPFSNACVPADMRDQVHIFVAPDGMTFEDYEPDATEPVGPPYLISNHGLRPGLPGDDRFALFMGPNVPRGSIASAEAAQVAPTLMQMLGLQADTGLAPSIFPENAPL